MNGEIVIPRATIERCQALVERVLLFTETPDGDLITLQHELAALLRLPQAATEPEHSIER